MAFKAISKLIVCCIALFPVLLSEAIRVDWNTNTGPIVPPTSTVPSVPKPPYAEPAPVWEDQSDDIPNPNPYQYVIPPTLLPPYNNPDRIPTPTPPPINYGSIITTKNHIANNLINDNYNKVVPSLSRQYIPNIGYKYFAVVPENNYNTNKYDEYKAATNDIYTAKLNKFNGKYNPKLKKYKAYENYKYIPYYVQYVPQQQPATTTNDFKSQKPNFIWNYSGKSYVSKS